MDISKLDLKLKVLYSCWLDYLERHNRVRSPACPDSIFLSNLLEKYYPPELSRKVQDKGFSYFLKYNKSPLRELTKAEMKRCNRIYKLTMT